MVSDEAGTSTSAGPERSDTPIPPPPPAIDNDAPTHASSATPNGSSKQATSNGKHEPDAKVKGVKDNPRWKGSYVQHNKVDDLKEAVEDVKGTVDEVVEVEDPKDARWKSCYVPAANGVNVEKMKVSDKPEDRRNSSPLPTKDMADPQARLRWGSQVLFVFSCVGYSIGVGGVLRFPFLILKYGGGAFLVPYLLCLVLVGLPLYQLELAVGQYSSLAPVKAWLCGGAFRGVGWSMFMLSVFGCLYYGQLMAYSLHYFGATLAYARHKLPWATCSVYPAAYCHEIVMTPFVASNVSLPADAYYFKHKLLHQPLNMKGDNAGDIGMVRWDLTLSLLASWVVVALVACRGVRSVGVGVTVTTVMGLVALVALAINCLQLEGANEGLKYAFYPHWSGINRIEAWTEALHHVLFSLSVGMGGILMYGSHNRFNYRFGPVSVLACLSQLGVSLLFATCVFAVFGALAGSLGATSASLPADEWLSFKTLLAGLSYASPVGHLWCAVVFLFVFWLALATCVGHFYTLMGSIQDVVKSLRSSSLVVASVLAGSLFLLGIPLCAEKKGFFLLGLVERYGLGISVMVVTLTELVVMSWVYGVRRFSDDIDYILGRVCIFKIFWKVCWAFVSPVFIFVVLIMSLVSFPDPLYSATADPHWGWVLRLAFPLCSVGLIGAAFLGVLLKRLFTGKLAGVFAASSTWGYRNSKKEGLDNPAMIRE